MSEYELYVFLLCLVVFIVLTAVSIVCVKIITNLTIRLIKSGAEDKAILKEAEEKRSKKNKNFKIIDRIVSFAICGILIIAFSGAMYVKATEKERLQNCDVYRVVTSGSMSEKHPVNTHLNGINNQLQTFDLIKTEPLPGEYELELYDIVVYEMDDRFIIHRIVEIEEPNEIHPDCRYFRLQGDANEYEDKFPVLYQQMRAIYSGDRIPNIGSLILFLQSPAGWLCIILCFVAMIGAPIIDKRLKKERDTRLSRIQNRINN